MPEQETYHNYARQYELLLNRIYPEKYPVIVNPNVEKSRSHFDLTLRNKQIIDKYRIHLENEGGKTLARRRRVLQILANLCELHQKDIEFSTKSDIEELVSKIVNNRKWNETTKSMHKQHLKAFFKWFKGENEYFPPEVSWIKTIRTKGSQKLPEEMITEEEVKRILDVADHPMKKALVSLMWETGGRASEIGLTNIRSLQFEGSEATIMLSGKTGMRQVLLISSVPILRDWLAIHPDKNNREAPLFAIVSNRNYGKRLQYASMRQILQKLMAKAEVNKPFNPHQWRHSRSTFLAGRLTEPQMCKVLGWEVGSDMPRIYIHLSGKDVNEAVRKIYGMGKKEKEEESKLSPKTCSICKEVNDFNTLLCKKCNNPLTLETRLVYRDKLSEIEKENRELKNVVNSLSLTLERINAKIDSISPAEARIILEEKQT